MYLGKVVELADTEDLFERPRHPYTERAALGGPRARRRGRRAPAADRARGRRAVADQPAARLPVPPALPAGARVLLAGGAGAGGQAGTPAQGHAGRLPLPGRARRSWSARGRERRDERDPRRAGRSRGRCRPTRLAAGPAIEGRSPWRLAWARLRSDRVAIVCGVDHPADHRCSRSSPRWSRTSPGTAPNDQDLTNGLTPAGPAARAERAVLVRHRRPGPRRARAGRLRRADLADRRRRRQLAARARSACWSA